MSHHNTVLSQILKLIPRHQFDTLAQEHHCGRSLRKASRWSQFVSMCLGQLSGRQSLRDIEANMKAQSSKLYHLGADIVPRTTLARINEKQPYALYEALFYKLLQRCQNRQGKHKFRFKNKLYSIDSTLIDLSLKVFPWADFNCKKAALKLHVGLDHDGYLPAFATVTESKKSDLSVARSLSLKPGSIVVCDRGYYDAEWFKSMNHKGIYFLTRAKKDTLYRTTESRQVDRLIGLTCDQTVELTGVKPRKIGLEAVRRIGYRDPETGQKYVYLTNNFRLSAKTIVAMYKERWQIELFFKWIKQNLNIKTFLGTSKNAILTQIWIALCAFLMLAYLRFLSRTTLSLQKILRLLQLNLFTKRCLYELINPDILIPPKSSSPQRAFW